MKRRCLTIFLLLVVLFASISSVNAAELRGTFTLTTQNTNVKVGDEVTVTLSIGKLDGFKITSFAAKKVFDSTIFEYIGTTGQNGWELKGDQTNIVLRNEQGATTGTMAVLKFKVLKEVEDTKIQLTEIDASSKEGGVYWEDNDVNEPFVQFKVISKDPIDDPNKDPVDDPTKDPTDDPTKDPVDDPTKNPTDDPIKDPVKDPTNDNKKPNNSGSTINNDKTTANSGKIPQTGEPYMLVLLVITAGIITVISFVKYKNTKLK